MFENAFLLLGSRLGRLGRQKRVRCEVRKLNLRERHGLGV